jgi:aspartyl-tRNA(Asn)/glutamyl-tRNA(Gln) amidotransferase subunit C
MTGPALTREDVLHIARLAHLDLTEAEVERFTKDLGAILAYASEIQRVTTAGVTPMAHASTSETVWREDVAEPSLDRAKALENAPDPAAGLFRVPKVRG